MKRHVYLTALCILAGINLVEADTYKSGNIDGETWNAAGSPYLITGDLSVNRLTVQPGVEVRFLGNYVLQVTGILRASGTTCSPILFTANTNAGWGGIFFNGSGSGSYLTYCRIEGSKNRGVRILNSTPAFTNCTIANNSSPGDGGGIHISNGSGTVILERCTISHNTTSLSGGGLRLQLGTAVVKNCLFSDNTAPASYGGGLYAAEYVNLLMTNCVVRNNSAAAGSGLAFDYHANALAVNCVFVYNVGDAINID